MFNKLYGLIELKIVPIANKLSTQRHLKAIRDSFISILPFTLVGGIAAVIAAAPAPEGTTNAFMLAWSSFAQNNSLILNWISALTLGGMSLYITVAVTYYLSRHYKIAPFQPIMLTLFGFIMLITKPLELGWAGKSIEISYIDGKGLLPAMLIAFFVVEAYHYMRQKNWGRIKMPDSVPASLTETFASLVPSVLIMAVFIAIFAVFNAFDTTLPEFIFIFLAPTLNAADSLFFTIIMTLFIHVFWFFGIHDAVFGGILGPIRDGNLSLNAAASLAGETLPAIFTTPFYVYFVIIGGAGSVLALAILLVRSKSKQLKTVGSIGLLPSFFGISEPIIFGVPIMLNPVFFIPFIFTSVANGTIAFLLMKFGFVGKSFAMFSWSMPSIFGAFLSTLDIRAMLLIVGLILLDMLMYYPFFKAYEKQLLKEENQ